MGKVLEVYWKWSKIGDTYLGRCIAGLDPDSDNFDVLPPHFILGYEHALKDESIKEAMEICFGPILKAWGDKCGRHLPPSSGEHCLSLRIFVAAHGRKVGPPIFGHPDTPENGAP